MTIAMKPTEKEEALWKLLDDIDTLDDACRGDDAEFRRRARAACKRRFLYFGSDGYRLTKPPDAEAQ